MCIIALCSFCLRLLVVLLCAFIYILFFMYVIYFLTLSITRHLHNCHIYAHTTIAWTCNTFIAMFCNIKMWQHFMMRACSCLQCEWWKEGERERERSILHFFLLHLFTPLFLLDVLRYVPVPRVYKIQCYNVLFCDHATLLPVIYLRQSCVCAASSANTINHRACVIASNTK